MAENFGHLSPRGSSGSSQLIIKMAYGITELCMRRDWFTEKTTTNAIFQFAKIENHSVIFQLYFSWKTYSKNEFHTFHSERYRFATSDPVKALETPADHRQNNHRLHIVQGITKNRTTLHNLPKSTHKIQLKNLDNKKSDLWLIIYLSLLLLKTVHDEINPKKKGRNVTQFFFSVTLQKRRRISRFCALFSTENPACLVSKFSARPGLLGLQFSWTAVQS